MCYGEQQFGHMSANFASLVRTYRRNQPWRDESGRRLLLRQRHCSRNAASKMLRHSRWRRFMCTLCAWKKTNFHFDITHVFVCVCGWRPVRSNETEWAEWGCIYNTQKANGHHVHASCVWFVVFTADIEYRFMRLDFIDVLKCEYVPARRPHVL